MAFVFPTSPTIGDEYTDTGTGLTWTWNGSSWVSTPDELTLGTDTAGSYVESLVAGTGVTLSNNSGEASTPTIEIGQAVGTSDNVTFNNVTVGGDLTVSGSTTTIDTSTLTVDDPLIILASNNDSTDVVDIGFYGLYDTSGSQDLYAGLFRDATDGKFKLFIDSQSSPTTTVDTGATGYTVATLVSDIEGDVTGTLTAGNIQIGVTTADAIYHTNSGTPFSISSASGVISSSSALFITGSNSDFRVNGQSGSAFAVDASANSVGIGTTSPSYPLDVRGDVGITGDLILSAGPAGNGDATIPGSLTVDTTTLVVNPSTNRVGIGTASPSYVLDVNGTARVSNDVLVGTDTLFVDVSADRVGIGTTSPTAQLDINSGVANQVIKIRPTTGGINTSAIEMSGTTAYYDSFLNQTIYTTDSASLTTSVTGSSFGTYTTLTSTHDYVNLPQLSVDSGVLYVSPSSNRVGINDTTPSYDLDVNGVARATGGVVTLTSSGAPTASLPDGAIAVDTTNDVMYVRSNGAWVESSGGASVTVSDAAPSGAEEGDLWYKSDVGTTLVYYDSAWVEITGSGSSSAYKLTSSSRDAALFIMEIGP